MWLSIRLIGYLLGTWGWGLDEGWLYNQKIVKKYLVGILLFCFKYSVPRITKMSLSIQLCSSGNIIFSSSSTWLKVILKKNQNELNKWVLNTSISSENNLSNRELDTFILLNLARIFFDFLCSLRAFFSNLFPSDKLKKISWDIWNQMISRLLTIFWLKDKVPLLQRLHVLIVPLLFGVQCSVSLPNQLNFHIPSYSQ